MDKKYAVIDLGTNTFHLLIASAGAQSPIREHYRERQFVQLAEAGIATIGPAPYQRAIQTLMGFRKILDAHGLPPEQAKAFGTAALRTASNGPQLMAEAQAKTSIVIQTISGDEEARLIHQGVRLATPDSQGRLLIMDIGGGSVEFIIAEGDQVLWARSFPIGVAVLYRDFHHSEPIAPSEVQALEQFLREALQPLRLRIQDYPTPQLVGASGTFDVLEQFVGQRPEKGTSSQIPATAFRPFYKKVLKMTLEERYGMPDMPSARAAMLPVALILVDVVMEMAATSRIIVSAYAMKEGMLKEMIQAGRP